MNFYWIYDIPNWLFLIICLAAFTSFSVFGALLFRNYFERWLRLNSDDNGIVGTFLSVAGMFYGITLGLIAVGAYGNFGTAESAVSNEASQLNGLYRDVNLLSRPEKEGMKKILADYATYMVEEAWPQQQRGEVPKGTSPIINRLEAALIAYPLTDEKDRILFAEIIHQNNKLSEARRVRVNVVQSSLPGPVWQVVLIGAAVIIFLTWLLVIKNRRLDLIVNLLTSALIGTLIFLVAAMDNPFRGEFSVSAEPFAALLRGLMAK
jgi:Protein of unknown function (DUF4239)